MERKLESCPRISRDQLRLSVEAPRLVVENVGACKLHHRGQEVNRAELLPGEIISLHNEQLLLCVRRPLRLPNSIVGLTAAPHDFGRPDESELVGESAAIWELRERLASIGHQPFHVLILGASGTGKELVARAIHARSARRSRPMLARNAATIPEGIADAELFGNVRGYPNVGMPERPGLVGAAHESTLFLDEIAELPVALQVRLLRVLDSGEYQRLGDASARRADVRVVGATNRPSTDLRHDVLARFTLQLALPDLNQRREDIPLLIAHLLRRHGRRDPSILTRFFPEADVSASPRVSPRLVEKLVLHQYTTNVRELESLLMAAVLESNGPYVDVNPSVLPQAFALQPLAGPEQRVGIATAGEAWLSGEDSLRLRLMRKHRFSPTACGRDPGYRGNRQTADLHFRHIAAKALVVCSLDTKRAAAMLVGEVDQPLVDRCQERLATFIANLEARIGRESPEELDRALCDDWKGLVDAARLLVDALRAKREEAGDSAAPLRSA